MVISYFIVVGTRTGKKEIPLIISHFSNSSLKIICDCVSSGILCNGTYISVLYVASGMLRIITYVGVRSVGNR